MGKALPDVYAVVMAGGKGERFWPQSRSRQPKQLLRLLGNLTLIEETVNRFLTFLPPEQCLVVTNQEYVPPISALLPSIPPENIIGEPLARDTAACGAIAAGLIRNRVGKHGNPVVILSPSDHAIKDENAFARVLTDVAAMAMRTNEALTIGVKPRFAATGYGYLKSVEKCPDVLPTVFHKSSGFVEKPTKSEAERFVQDGNYWWNSGIFTWRLSALEQSFADYAPEFSDLVKLTAGASCEQLSLILPQAMEKLPNISFDYAIMEKLPYMLMAEAVFDWEDVGSWTALRSQFSGDDNGNVVQGLFAGLNVTNSIVVGDDDHLIAAVDVSNLIMVHTADATLICSADSAQRVKNLLKLIGENPDQQKFL